MLGLSNGLSHFAEFCCRAKLHPNVSGNFVLERSAAVEQDVHSVVHIECGCRVTGHPGCRRARWVFNRSQISDGVAKSYCRVVLIHELELVQSRRHELAFALANAVLDRPAQAAMAKAHADMFALLKPCLMKMRISETDGTIELIGGAVMTAGQLLRRRGHLHGLVDCTVAFVLAGTRARIARSTRR
jgi:hypothetical protein